MNVSGLPFPGHASPDAGVDEPFELLAACHDRAEHHLCLLERLVTHLESTGGDDEARRAFASLERYFTVAAPLHFEDEELHLLPLLEVSRDSALVAACARIREDHAQFANAWRALSTSIAEHLADGGATATMPGLREQVAHYVAAHRAHIALEDDLIFPEAERRAGSHLISDMSADMLARRRG